MVKHSKSPICKNSSKGSGSDSLPIQYDFMVVGNMASQLTALITTWPSLDVDQRTLNKLMKHGGSATRSLEILRSILLSMSQDMSPKK